jgi:hypothetical protein
MGQYFCLGLGIGNIYDRLKAEAGFRSDQRQIVRRDAGVISLIVKKFERGEGRIDAYADDGVFPDKILLGFRQIQDGTLSEGPCRQDNQQKRDIYTAGEEPE